MLKHTSESREQQLKELKNFTDDINKEIVDIVGSLGWTMESVSNAHKEYLACPYDPSHRLTTESFNNHLISCQWKAEGYGKSDVPLSESTLPANSPFSIKFDEHLQSEILRKAKEQNPSMQIGMGERLIPRTSDRLLTDFTSDERRALYDYVIANTSKLDIGQDIEDINNLKPQQAEDKQLSFLEMLIYERNMKRRRAKHKGVHTNKKSQVEVLREVINQQMEIYAEYISGQTVSEFVTDSEPMDVQSTTVDDSSYERAERLYKVFHSPSQSHDDFNSEERNDHHRRKSHQEWLLRRKDDRKEEYLEEKSYHRSRDQDRRERLSEEKHKKHEYGRRRKSSHSKDRKSHKQDKHRSKDKYKDKYRERIHKSRHYDKSPERRHSSKHSDYKRKERNKEH